MTEKNRPYKIFYDVPKYIIDRDRLIPQAEDYANRTAGLRPETPGGAWSYKGRNEIQAWCDLWSFTFHQEMNRLAIEEGLCQWACPRKEPV